MADPSPLPPGTPAAVAPTSAGTPKTPKKPQKKSTCRVCDVVVTTYNLKRHIRLKHPEIYDETMSIQEMFARIGLAWTSAPVVDNDNEDIPAGKIQCQLCRLYVLPNNMKRHLKNKHASVYEEGLTVQEIFDKVTPFPDLSGDEVRDGEDEPVELALTDDEGEYDADADAPHADDEVYGDEVEHEDKSDDIDEEEGNGQQDGGDNELIERERKGWMSFGRM